MTGSLMIIFASPAFAPPTPSGGMHFCTGRLVTDGALSSSVSHAHWMPCLHCELPKILEDTRPPDPDMVDMIEQAFLEGQIDGQKAELAYLWLRTKTR